MPQMLLEVENLKKHFPIKRGVFSKIVGKVYAVDGISLRIDRKQTLGLVGESGCGKTTAGKTILKLLEPTGGAISYGGEDITRYDRHEMKSLRRKMQIIFQDPFSSLNPTLTIGNAIMEPMQVHKVLGSDKERNDRVIELLETVNLKADHFNRYPHEFSGGQRQRICIARALSLNPKFIICDESVSALDVSIQAQVLNLLSDLKAKFVPVSGKAH